MRFPSSPCLKLNAQSVGYPDHVIKEGGDMSDVYNVGIRPAGVSQLLHVFLSHAGGVQSQEFRVLQHRHLLAGQAGIPVVVPHLQGQLGIRVLGTQSLCVG